MRSTLSCVLSVWVAASLLGSEANGQATITVTNAKALGSVQRFQASGETTAVTLKINAPAGYTDFTLAVESLPTLNVQKTAIGTAVPITLPKDAFDRDIQIDATITGKDLPELKARAFIRGDSKKPEPLTPVVERFPGGGGTLTIGLTDIDLDAASVTNDCFRVLREVEDAQKSTQRFPIFPEGSPVVSSDRRTIVLNFRYLDPGNYWIVISKLNDLVGNAISDRPPNFDPNSKVAVQLQFTVPGGSQQGGQVEYPRFVRPGDGTASEFDPGDRVDTRVVQLYYFRDARRIVELINRNVKDLNQAGYDEAQRFAQEARKKAEERIDERRFDETLAVESAVKARETEAALSKAREALAKAQQAKADLIFQRSEIDRAIMAAGGDSAALDASVTTTNNEVNTASTNIKTLTGEIALLKKQLQGASDDTARKNIQSQLDQKNADLDANKATLAQQKNKLTTLRALKANVDVNTQAQTKVGNEITALDGEAKRLPQQLDQEQKKEIEDRNNVVKSEANELRAAQEQFRREVAAGLADRNSYAQGRPQSFDPVSQVSISVVGTSRIHLRGPVKGVNKICRMIHQLDSPVGQVKIGIHTVQVNGEHGDRMDFVYERINQEVAHSRFLVNTSGQLLRRAVQEVASEVALAADQGYLPENCPPELMAGRATLDGMPPTTQDQRDRRYMYAFFGSDFIGELEEMDSELLNTENKMLSLHSMDTLSFAGALFVMAHADHPVRQRIVQRFQELVAGELPQRETEYVQALTHVTSCGKSLDKRYWRAMQIDAKNAEAIYFNASRTYYFPNTIAYFNEQVSGQGTLNPVQYATIKMAQALKAQLVAEMELKNHVLERSLLETRVGATAKKYVDSVTTADEEKRQASAAAELCIRRLAGFVNSIQPAVVARAKADNQKNVQLNRALDSLRAYDTALRATMDAGSIPKELLDGAVKDPVSFAEEFWLYLELKSGRRLKDTPLLSLTLDAEGLFVDGESDPTVTRAFEDLQRSLKDVAEADRRYLRAVELKNDAEEELFSQRLLDQFIDEQEEKSVELMEALRSNAANVDNYIKRLAIAVEDDVAAQFYEPAFQRIRRVSRTWDVTLGQIETTTILTNNRTLAKVSPAGTFEFNLPKREIAITEAMKGTKALADEYGNLLKDPTFLAGTSLLSGQTADGIVGSNAASQTIPGLSTNHEFGSDLQKLIPQPAIYKFETGTGFEIQPIIQPDGHSIVYGFDYEYSTNVREPVRADEKHLGRIKRHFVHTDVQTSSYELREISRYTVALKAARTDRGVPLFEDIPVVGAAFRPLPSEESSLQTNIILGSSTIYPTVFDLMGLRWSAYVDQLTSPGVAEEKTTQATRRQELRSHLLQQTRERVNRRIRLSEPTPPSTNFVTP